jgi:hypothetical protein
VQKKMTEQQILMWILARETAPVYLNSNQTMATTNRQVVLQKPKEVREKK